LALALAMAAASFAFLFCSGVNSCVTSVVGVASKSGVLPFNVLDSTSECLLFAFSFALATAAETFALLFSEVACVSCRTSEEGVASFMPSSFILLLANFLALTLAHAAATADLAPLASGVFLFIAALRASAAFLCFAIRSSFSFSKRNLCASNHCLASSDFI